MSKPKPDIVKAVRNTTTTRASTLALLKLTPNRKTANMNEMATLSMPSNTCTMALPMNKGSLGAGVARRSGKVPPHLSLFVMLTTENTVFHDNDCMALPMAM